MDANILNSPQMAINIAILTQLKEIKDRLDHKIPHLIVEDAVNNYYNHHLSKIKKKTRKNYQTILMRFQKEFEGRNLADSADINAETIAEFIEKYWPENEANTRYIVYASLKSFINWCKRYQIRRGLPDFPNPCDAMVGEYAKSQPKQPVFDDETIHMLRRFINSADNPRMKATFIVLCTSGMRANEICNTRRDDINGQIITLTDHKGIRWNTPNPKHAIAVIPKLASDLIEYYDLNPPFLTYRMLSYSFKKRIDWGILPKGTVLHDFRKYVSTFWHRKGDVDMMRFVLRHKSDKGVISDPLSHIYISNITAEDAIRRLEVLEEELFANM